MTTERAARNPDVLVATLARIIRAIAEREAAEKAERKAAEKAEAPK